MIFESDHIYLFSFLSKKGMCKDLKYKKKKKQDTQLPFIF